MMLRLEVRHLRLVAAIAEEGGVTRAAEKLHVTQSALSHQLHDVEGRLGTPLFLRLRRRMVPTAAGERLVASARTLLGEIRRVEEEVGRLAGDREGVIRLATECYTCYHWIPAVVGELGRVRPKVDIEIVADATRRPIEALLDGRIDLAIGATPVRSRKLVIHPLFEDEMVAVMAPSHPLARRPRLAPSDFADQNLILYVPPAESTLFRRVLDPAGVSPRQVTVIQLTEAIVEMVKAGLGISVLARWAVAPQLAAGSLSAVRITGRGLKRRWYAATRRERSAPAYLEDFVRLLARVSLPRAGTGGLMRAGTPVRTQPRAARGPHIRRPLRAAPSGEAPAGPSRGPDARTSLPRG